MFSAILPSRASVVLKMYDDDDDDEECDDDDDDDDVARSFTCIYFSYILYCELEKSISIKKEIIYIH